MNVNRKVNTSSYGGSGRNTFRFSQGGVNNQLTLGIDFIQEKGEANTHSIKTKSHNLY